MRRRIKRFLSLGETLKKLFSPNLEKSLIFLDDSLLPATSNAVERANRRHRKMQKSVYRVRTRDHISQRIAIDMLRDAYACGRNETVNVLHHTRKRELLCRYICYNLELFDYYVRMCILICTMWQGVVLLPAALHGIQGLHLVKLYAPA